MIVLSIDINFYVTLRYSLSCYYYPNPGLIRPFLALLAQYRSNYWFWFNYPVLSYIYRMFSVRNTMRIYTSPHGYMTIFTCFMQGPLYTA